MTKTPRAGVGTALAAALIASAPPLAAQPAAAYPTKPVRLIVSSGAGGGLDFVARLVAVPLGEHLGQTMVVDNRAGASGSIAAEMCSLAPPDGYTLMFLSASLVVYGIVNKTRYDLYRDFDPVSQVAAAPYILTVHPDLSVKTVKELIAYAKANPAKLNYASTGNGSGNHLGVETLVALLAIAGAWYACDLMARADRARGAASPALHGSSAPSVQKPQELVYARKECSPRMPVKDILAPVNHEDAMT